MNSTGGPTKRALDWWKSAASRSGFNARTFFGTISLVHAHPPASNASRWAANEIYFLPALEVTKDKPTLKQKPPSQPMSADKLGLRVTIGIGIGATFDVALNNIA